MMKIGFILNPIAGIGGKVGLKGSDGQETLTRALALGAKPESAIKAKVALDIIKASDEEPEIITYPGEMGEDLARECGFKVSVSGDISKGNTTADDTIHAAQDLREAGVDIILFAGGDGTARNVMDSVGLTIPVIGIPAGCKIHSAVYALNPRNAGELIVKYLKGSIKDNREAEVMDINEDLFRQNIIQARLYGYLNIPNERKMVQNLKSGRGISEKSSLDLISNYIADTLIEDTLYIIGPGTTTRDIMDKIGLENTLLGVDLIYNRAIIKNDATEKDILEALNEYGNAKIVVTVIGGQGYIFGRGNQQISAEVITRVGKENIVVAASKDKVLSLFGCKLYLDTGVESVNKALCGYYKVITGYQDYVMFEATD